MPLDNGRYVHRSRETFRGKVFDSKWKGFLHDASMLADNDNLATDPVMVSPRLRAVREALKLSKAQFADQIGIDRSSWTKIEKAEKPILPPLAHRIWQLYGVDMNYIYLGRVDGLPSHLSSKVIASLNGPNS